MVFVFFFLAEYGSIVLISTITIHLFFGGYLLPSFLANNFYRFTPLSLESLILALKTSFILFLFVWFRASLPRVKYDQLMTLCWTALLPLVVGFIILIPSLLIAFDIYSF